MRERKQLKEAHLQQRGSMDYVTETSDTAKELNQVKVCCYFFFNIQKLMTIACIK